jgi:hypothetical protein
MNKHPVVYVWMILSLILLGCGVASPSPGAEATPTPAAATATPPPVVPEPTVSLWMSTCQLLDSRDLAHFYTSAEVPEPVHQAGDVDHPIFSTESISATESSCIFLVFHRPGHTDQKFLQVTYWIDLAGPVSPEAWAQVWADAQAQAAQTVPGVGEGAFYSGGRLTFKKGSVYVTIEVIGTDVTTDTSAGIAQQIEMEKQMALDMLGRMG